MKGLEQLREMRMNRTRPPVLLVDVDSGAPLEDHQLGLWLSVGKDDRLHRLDLRPVHGLTVYVLGAETDAVCEVCRQLMRAEAKEVVGFAGQEIVFKQGPLAWLN